MEANGIGKTAAGAAGMVHFSAGRDIRSAGGTLVLWVSVAQRNLERLGLAIVVTSPLGPAIAVFDTARCPGAEPKTCRSPPAAASRPAPDDVDLDLLERAQAYLARLRAGITPGAAALEAWKAFFAAFDPLVRRTVLGCRLPPAEVEDCVQEAWMEILEKLAAFRFDGRRGRFQG